VEVKIMEIVIEQCRSPYEQTIQTAFSWVLIFLQKYKVMHIQMKNRKHTGHRGHGNHTKTQSFFKVVLTPSQQNSKESISSVSEFHDGGESLMSTVESTERRIPVHLFPKTLDIIIPCFNHINPDIKKLANGCNNELITILEFFGDSHNTNIKLFEEVLKNYFSSEEKESTLELVLQWVGQLFKKFHDEMFIKVDTFMQSFITILSHSNDQLFNNALDLICEIAKFKDEYIEITILTVLDRLKMSKKLLDNRGMTILKKLCTALNVDRVYSTLADVLLRMDDSIFVGKMINILSVFLLTNKETESLRNCLKGIKKSNNEHEKQFFEKIFRTWSYNPISCITICMIAEYFELSYFLIVKL
jgi:vacuole morphology and inheritance protein 14